MHQITGNTRIFGILADPIQHVKTPQGINQHFAAEAFDGVMVPIHVGEGELATVRRLTPARTSAKAIALAAPPAPAR